VGVDARLAGCLAVLVVPLVAGVGAARLVAPSAAASFGGAHAADNHLRAGVVVFGEHPGAATVEQRAGGADGDRFAGLA